MRKPRLTLAEKFRRTMAEGSTRLDMPLEPNYPYDARAHCFAVVGSYNNDGTVFRLKVPEMITMDVRREVAAGLRCVKTGAWIGSFNDVVCAGCGAARPERDVIQDVVLGNLWACCERKETRNVL